LLSSKKIFRIVFEPHTGKTPLGKAFGMGRDLLQRFGVYPPAGERRTRLYGMGSQAGKVHYVVVTPVKRIPDRYMKYSQLLLDIF